MSYVKCDEFQETDMGYYYRWKNANIEIRGCMEHVREIMNELNARQQELRGEL